MDIDALIDRIYEASVLEDRWPVVLQAIADGVGAKGATIMMRSPQQVSGIASSCIVDDLNDYMVEGWGQGTDHAKPLFEEQWPGFRPECHYRSPAEIAAMPVHAEFLDPRGYIAGVGTVIQGTGDRLIHVAIEGFASHALAQRSVPSLDTLRPHLARSISLTALRAQSSQIVVDSLAAVGTAAAVVAGDGRLRSANALFLARMGNRMIEGRSGLRFTDAALAAQLSFALKRHHDARYSGVQSVPVRDSDGELPFAIHLLPIIGAAQSLCNSDGVILMISHPANACVPSADLLRLLFDLTPMEARVTRHLLHGGTLRDVTTLHISEGTAKTHLKAVFLKTGVARQSELMRLLGAIGAAGDEVPNT